jgi:hypothetical protein
MSQWGWAFVTSLLSNALIYTKVSQTIAYKGKEERICHGGQI